jgi:ABC-type spermidine/putrescine transport system permease subunit I
MLPSQIAFIFAAGYFLLSAVIGGIAGSLASAILRQRWRPKTLLLDMGIACATMTVVIFVGGSYDYYHGTLHDDAKQYVLAGAAAPLVLHVIRFVLDGRSR